MGMSTAGWAKRFPLFQAPFRVFFLSSAISAAALVPIWLMLFAQDGATSMVVPPLLWHQHEMLVGFLNAAIAGFILTAVANWTRTPAVSGWPLIGLWGLWLAGRLTMALGGASPLLASLVDLGFMPTLAAIVGIKVWRARQPRQTVLVIILMLFWALDLCFHVSGNGRFLHAMVLLAATLIVVIGGRITPAFTANWLRLRGDSGERIRRFPVLDRLGLAACFALVLFVVFGWRSPWLVTPVAFLAGLLVLVRLAGWSGWRTGAEPLIWILHVGHLWLVLGFWLEALSAIGLVPATAWLHALGAGAVGTMIVAVMTRVSVGHTGRPLRLLPGAIWIYGAILTAGMLRVFTALGWIPFMAGVWAAAGFWTLAFVMFLGIYGLVLCRRRID